MNCRYDLFKFQNEYDGYLDVDDVADGMAADEDALIDTQSFAFDEFNLPSPNASVDISNGISGTAAEEIDYEMLNDGMKFEAVSAYVKFVCISHL